MSEWKFCEPGREPQVGDLIRILKGHTSVYFVVRVTKVRLVNRHHRRTVSISKDEEPHKYQQLKHKCAVFTKTQPFTGELIVDTRVFFMRHMEAAMRKKLHPEKTILQKVWHPHGVSVKQWKKVFPHNPVPPLRSQIMYDDKVSTRRLYKLRFEDVCPREVELKD
mmetsp:Transcript_2566/g.4138  ORF Transcript_2566/g.4138 Transcript_2566/m.4138 type:complete len:165 (+) Transcript_2566:576-1070(+)|eukprot:CAMPEP_0184291966 /NCGR_PEP_ID=MMETSP1049-20130417/3829_1 /TAXON_ID=77928 /ORGANISM="Proteomonas sulcata, Strain CCMP704" /LENGTH=164 /DNA_ID=CAMNT_0026599555 /DNA_START=351 /DNA_END=845 /DNA_ORIENTATION=-